MGKRTSVTIEHVAQAAGVSRQTVSRVINRGPNVKPAMRERVESAVEELGYVPNLSARRMGGGKSFLILAINDRQRTLENWQAGRGNDWVDQMLYGGMTECEKHGFHLVFELIDADPQLAPRQLSRVLSSLRPDGVVLTPPHSDNLQLLELLADRQIPCARIGKDDGSSQVDIFMDEAGAAGEATRHLLAHGHRQIAFVAGAPEYGNSRKRIEGFRAALADAGLPENAGLVANGDFRFDTAAGEIARLLDGSAPPSAIIADNDEMAFAALHLADQRSICVPGQLSVISFEDTPGVRFSVPPLTAIRQPTAEMIGKACERLIAIANGAAGALWTGESPGSDRFEMPYRLINRATTGPRAA
ncbi:LacI family DNA-binding transcriptional regulator [Pontixanthobacter sp.]|uniref:LacI family DNA-binding transcriptional regulator n=1 Tax=Pontixanthobacter sp. TaxID=2792078 RepID=UPI003C7E7732